MQRFRRSIAAKSDPNCPGRTIPSLVASHLAENRHGYAGNEGWTDETVEWKVRVEAAERKRKEARRKEE